MYIIYTNSMRAINITGKHNIDKINEIGDEKYQAVRRHMRDTTELTPAMQLDLIRQLYLDMALVFPLKSLIISELNHKIQGYKGQDLKKEIHESATLINLEDVLEKLVAGQLTCCYCANPVMVLYKNVRDPLQWTLDRMDNALSHTKENTCIACLKCNLQRRVMNVDKFTFTKKLKIKKV
jgi:hypothetical protein